MEWLEEIKSYSLILIIVISLIACAPKQGAQKASDSADKAEAAYQKGKAAKDLRNYDMAWKAFTQAVDLAPNNSLYLNEAGFLADTLGHSDKAIEYLNKALAIDLITYGPDHPTVSVRWNNLGGVWQDKGNYGKAREHYEKALGIVKKAGIKNRIRLMEGNIRSLPPEE